MLKERKLLPEFKQTVDVYFCIEDESLRLESLSLIQKLRDNGATVEYPLSSAKYDKQYKRAMELDATWFIKFEKDSSGKIGARVKNTRSREESTITPDEILNLLKPISKNGIV
ncbi:MAG TPA: hypothetical protein PLW02_07775 [Verrucomicrobiota bacterium]|nr:hypothetical protein [Verrucomicrobiota bacterium]